MIDIRKDAVPKMRFGDRCTAIIDQLQPELEQLSLFEPLLQMVHDNGAANDLPYHNLHHTLCVLRNSLEGARFMRLSPADRTAVAIAAMYHDFHHSGGAEADSLNVGRAIDSMAEAFADTCFYLAGRLIVGMARRAIRCTQYPFDTDPQTPLEDVLRDADILQCLEPNWEAQILVGLREEVNLGRRLAGQPEYSGREWCMGQAKFLGALKFHSPWGETKRPAVTERLLELESYEDAS